VSPTTIRWGILGTGRIAGLFATGLTVVPDAELAAVGSRAIETAERFGDEFGVPRRHASYEALAEDDAVDVIYVATPHPMHHPAVRLCLEAGKPVLCEKPFTINAAQAADLIALARDRRLFLMEAMWTRFLPLIGRFRELIAAGAIGEPRLLTADFGFRHPGGPEHRLFNPDLGGGALLDVGVYLVSLASMVFGAHDRAIGLAHLGPTGVDEQASLVFGYPGGQLAQLTAATRTDTPQEVTLMGTEGSLRIHPLWWKPTRMTLTRPDGSTEPFDIPYDGNGYGCEAAEVMRCLRAGALESPIMPLDETLAVVQTLDGIRAQWGLRYPME
jgi:predicted dehydrogenase